MFIGAEEEQAILDDRAARPHAPALFGFDRRDRFARDAVAAQAIVRIFEEAAEMIIIGDRKSVVSGKSVAVRVDLGGRRISKKKIDKRIHTRVIARSNT